MAEIAEARTFDDKPPKPEGLQGPEADRQAQAMRDRGVIGAPDPGEEPEAHPS
jgi:hypothetical protein